MLNIKLNGKEIKINPISAFNLQKEYTQDEDESVIIVNGFQISNDIELSDNDEIVIIKKGVMPKKEEWESMLSARHSPGVYNKLKSGKVAIAGLGGLGSNIALMLARSGVGKLLLVDFDIIEPSNLNRQQYTIEDLGMFKTEAIKRIIAKINPFIDVEIKTEKVTDENAKELFSNYDIVCEAFDKADQKAMLINAVSRDLPDTKMVCGSGMAGYESSNTIKTRQLMKNVYICGDLKSEAQAFNGLMAPRVSICAGHEANMIMRLLLDIEDV
ncbi:sulfur carrier protein ThiS adenylyltransferase ThiF [Methanobrevibacter filiformis]|uniref:Putative adenylyltransferase/sulfurtransferase MoeZ n=1 Tax=Methanobrevibacter filiformis TaxID=55758 RepID=A0A166ERF3_9EURY|nr:sulfur carrier protein ThiS adenylyltransferase ThiF [Methanobrevibacter filiformis]KZX16930.1 putative adenylyltransferase/sulfurtransferase MoeZ [Methanobrevibacter filiformis]